MLLYFERITPWNKDHLEEMIIAPLNVMQPACSLPCTQQHTTSPFLSDTYDLHQDSLHLTLPELDVRWIINEYWECGAAQLVDALCHKMGGSGFDSRQCPWKVSSPHLAAWVHSASNNNEHLGDKVRPAYRWRLCIPSCAECWSADGVLNITLPPPLPGCSKLVRESFTFAFHWEHTRWTRSWCSSMNYN